MSGLNLKFSDHVIEADDEPFKGSTEPMVDLDMYKFKDLNTGKLHPKNSLWYVGIGPTSNINIVFIFWPVSFVCKLDRRQV